MSGRDYELERLSNEMDAAQREIDGAKSRLDAVSSKRNGIKSQMESVNYRIADIKRCIDSEYDAMRICYQAKDRYHAEDHKYRAQSFKDGLQREYDMKNGYRSQLDMYRSEFESALSALRGAKDRKQRAREAFNARLEQVKAQHAMERAKWKEKNCRICGTQFKYHIDWKRVPDLCKSCAEREKAKWHETTCKKCGKAIRYHEEWTHIPSICKECKANYKK